MKALVEFLDDLPPRGPVQLLDNICTRMWKMSDAVRRAIVELAGFGFGWKTAFKMLMMSVTRETIVND